MPRDRAYTSSIMSDGAMMSTGLRLQNGLTRENLDCLVMPT